MAKSFKFNLQKVLDYRAQLEDQAKQALAKALAAHQAQECLMRSLEAAMAAHHETLAKAQSFTAADIWLWRAYKDRLVNDLSQAREHERVLAQEVHQRRAELVQKAKDRKLLDKLKEKQGIRHELEERLREQSVYDEMATLRHQPQAV